MAMAVAMPGAALTSPLAPSTPSPSAASAAAAMSLSPCRSHPRRLSLRLRREPTVAGASHVCRAVPMDFIHPVEVSCAQWELIEGNLFATSLFPYLAFLYFLGMPECKMPPRALFGRGPYSLLLTPHTTALFPTSSAQ